MHKKCFYFVYFLLIWYTRGVLQILRRLLSYKDCLSLLKEKLYSDTFTKEKSVKY